LITIDNNKKGEKMEITDEEIAEGQTLLEALMSEIKKKKRTQSSSYKLAR
jgi:hypothetical protein